MTSETASASVAASSTPALRRLDNLSSVIGEPKPTIPVSSVMIVILAVSFGESVGGVAKSRRMRARVRPDLGEVVEE
jgi:hypothetical protein